MGRKVAADRNYADKSIQDGIEQNRAGRPPTVLETGALAIELHSSGSACGGPEARRKGCKCMNGTGFASRKRGRRAREGRSRERRTGSRGTRSAPSPFASALSRASLGDADHDAGAHGLAALADGEALLLLHRD